MTDWIRSVMASLGYPGLALLLFLENVVPPIPSEAIVPLAGFMTEQGEMTYIGVVVAGSLGSLIGSLPLYWLGRALGEERLRRFARGRGRWFGLAEDDIDRSKRWFDRHGGWAVLLCRLVPGVRSYIAIPAGCARMPLWRYLAWSSIGITAWIALLAWIGRLLGRDHERADTYLSVFTYVVMSVLLTTAVTWVVRRRRTTPR